MRLDAHHDDTDKSPSQQTDPRGAQRILARETWTQTAQRGDVVLVPFPFTDLTRQKARPAVVISSERFNASSADVVLVAISSRLPASPNDTDLIMRHSSTGFQATGLRVSSVIRTTKLVTLQQSLIYTTLGKLDSRMIGEVDGRLARAVGLQTLSDALRARQAAEARVETLTARVNDLEERLTKSQPSTLP